MAFRATLAVAYGVSAQDPCRPLCSFDAARTGQCQVSRQYEAKLLSTLQVGPWADIAAQLASCEAASASSCASQPNCELDSSGLCTASRAWSAQQLTAPSSTGGLGFGSERCGLLGLLVASDVECNARSQSACEADASARVAQGGIACGWNATTSSCTIRVPASGPLLLKDLWNELARVQLRRSRCAQSSGGVCSGSCRSGSSAVHCSLDPMESLMPVLGEDCPVVVAMLSHSFCNQLQNSTICSTLLRSDGLQKCQWRSGSSAVAARCEAHPAGLELDLLQSLGLDSKGVLPQLQAAQKTCASFGTNSTTCSQPCAPPVVVLSSGASSNTAGLTLSLLSAYLWWSRQR